MTIKEILDTGLINRAVLAKKVWPNDKQPGVRLAQKLAESNGQRLLPDDEAKIREVLTSELFR